MTTHAVCSMTSITRSGCMLSLPWVPLVINRGDLSTPRGESATSTIMERTKKRRYRDEEETYAHIDTEALRMVSLAQPPKDKNVAFIWRRMQSIKRNDGDSIALALQSACKKQARSPMNREEHRTCRTQKRM